MKSFKTLKKIKTYFICINNRYKITRKIHKKEKIQKINRTIHFHTLKRFVSSFSQSIYTSQLSISFRRIINYRKQKNVNENVYFNYHEQGHITMNCSKSKKWIVQMNNLDLIFNDDFDLMHIINELNSNYVSSNIDFNFERKN